MPLPCIGITCGTAHLSPPSYDPSATAAHIVRRAYVQAVVRAGGAPLLIPALKEEEVLDRIFAAIDGLFLPGGDDLAPARYGQEPHPALGEIDPDRDASELYLIRRALDPNSQMPVLGICRGIQALNVAGGGTLLQDIPAQVRNALQHRQKSLAPLTTHTVYLEPGTRLRGIFGVDSLATNTAHHQAVDRVADGFVVSARSADGIVEGIEKPEAPFVLGVQCHPENLTGNYPPFQRLFDAFVAAAAR